MQHARGTLRKIFAETLRREGGDNAAMLAWPVACGSTVAGKTSAISYADGLLVVGVPDVAWRYQLQSLAQQYLAALNQVSAQKVKQISFIVSAQDKPVQH